MKPMVALACSTALLVAAGAMQARADWNGLAAPGFSYCYVTDPCKGLCEEWLLALNADCSRNCDVLGEDPSYPCGAGTATFVSAARSWSVSGKDEDRGNVPFVLSLTAVGQRTGSDTFLVQVSKSQFAEGRLEVAVFRYAGDPSAFDGLAPTSVFDLVEWGIIAADDVLLAKGTAEIGSTFSFVVDVPGLPDEEIVLMTTGAADFAASVPATSPLVAACLALIVLALGTAAVLRPRRASTS